ncbi:MAG TPA: hypothetical protein EYO33_09070 [Phycisphaerales bacterium]|nr:hypothetical protein [Phycisphaerales bacterium]
MKEDPQESIGRAIRRLYRATQDLKPRRVDTAQLEAAQVLITDWLGQQNRELGSEHRQCAICQRDHGYDGEMKDYPGVVCRDCDTLAVNEKGRSAKITGTDEGYNPVYIGGIKCWRRYRFGGYITMRDDNRCSTLDDFYQQQYPEWNKDAERG